MEIAGIAIITIMIVICYVMWFSFLSLTFKGAMDDNYRHNAKQYLALRTLSYERRKKEYAQHLAELELELIAVKAGRL